MGQWNMPGDDREPLTLEQISRMLHCSGDTIMGMVDDGEFPQPLKTGPQSKPLWAPAVIDTWIFLRPMMRPKESGKKPPKEEK